MTLLDIVKDRTLEATGMTIEEMDMMIHADDSVLHDPFLYDGMQELVNRLHAFKQKQDENPDLLLVIDTDYDTDGVMSACVLSAALDVFNINHRIYIPSMIDGYGLNEKAVKEMEQFETGNYRIGMILTADNGTNAINGVAAAKQRGIEVLVTDHHLGGDEYADADVIVNPNKRLADGSPEPYPFKGNAGATVAWKAMMAYSSVYTPGAKSLIRDLIVFAGIANVADVMPIVDENHYIVKEAVHEIKRLVSISELYSSGEHTVYTNIKNTPYIHYNTVFYGLYDLITLLQESKDAKRIAKNKKPIPLKTDEELIGWYLSPMINAPRRIHETCAEAMLAFMATSSTVRKGNITAMITMNEKKSELRNSVTSQINWDELRDNSGNVLFVNAPHGISGLIAGQVLEKTGKATMVFSYPTTSSTKVYPSGYFDDRFDKDELIIGASARSTNNQPLNVIMARINEIRPDIIVGGGGHAAAAGYSIWYKHLEIFKVLFNKVSEQVEEAIHEEYMKLVESGEITVATQNVINLSFYDGEDTATAAHYNLEEHEDTFKNDMLCVHEYQDELKPFGKDFNAQTEFTLDIDPMKLLEPQYGLNLDFWKTFKFNLYGVDVLTFDIGLADTIKTRIEDENPAIIKTKATLELNEFRGIVTPQLQLKPL